MSGGFNLRQANASLGAHRAVLEFADPVQGGHIDQHSALKGHQLAIITGGATAQGQRQLLRYAGGNQLPQLFLVARTTTASACFPSSCWLSTGLNQWKSRERRLIFAIGASTPVPVMPAGSARPPVDVAHERSSCFYLLIINTLMRLHRFAFMPCAERPARYPRHHAKQRDTGEGN